MSTAFDTIASLLLKLDPIELQEVRTRCAIRLQMGGASRSTASAAAASGPQQAAQESDIDMVLGELISHMHDEGIEFASLVMLKSVTSFRTFAEKVPPTMVYFRRASTNRTKLRALIRMSIKLLYKDMARMNISPSTRTMMNHWHRIPAIINQSFPGYAKSGMLGLLVNSGSIDLKYVSEATERKR